MASVPLKQHRKAWESAWLQSTMAGAGTLLLLAVIMRDLGPTTDEFTYIECCRQVDRWVSDLPDLGTSNFTAKRLQEGWPFATTNNKSLTVPALCAWIGRSAIGRFDQPPHSWRWGNSLLFAATTGLIFYWLKVECSTRAAIVAVATLLGTPRLMANACLFSVDPIVGCFGSGAAGAWCKAVVEQDGCFRSCSACWQRVASRPNRLSGSQSRCVWSGVSFITADVCDLSFAWQP